jgi:hypothetical protein
MLLAALCYRRMSVPKWFVTKLQKLKASPLAQIYLLTMVIDLPSDVQKFRHFGRHLEFLKTNI